MTSLMYLAGIFDGEGSVIIQQGPNHALQCSVGMKDKRVLDLFYERYGGSLYRRAGEMWQWQLTAHKAAEMLTELSPYLVTKKEQAWLAREFVAQKKSDRSRVTDEERALREGYRLAIHFAKARYD